MRTWWHGLIVGYGGLLVVAPAQAALHTEVVEYRHGSIVLEGYLAYDDALQTKRPGVLVVHEWKGLNEYAKRRARQLVPLGYIAFAIDMYGRGVVARDHEEAAKLSGVYRNDRQLMRERAKAGLDVLRQHPLADASRLAAIGYCFGGTTVLELARGGEPLRGVASFHGGLGTPHPEDARQITGKVLVLHGAKDPHVTPEDVAAFEREMREAGVNYRLITYADAVHSFTVAEAGDDPSTGLAYNADADRTSWQALQRFLQEVLGR